MGGETAKERRRLKRLQAQKESGGDTPASSVAPAAGASGASPKSSGNDGSTPAQTKRSGEKGTTENARLRLQRKMSRKASGKFKAQTENSPPTSAHRKRTKYDDASGRSKAPSRPQNQYTAKNDNRSSQKYQHKSTPSNHKFGKQKGKERPAKKPNNAKQKVKKDKPKHLKRKMDELSKTLSKGSADGDGKDANISELEAQMENLARQMEEYKKLKLNKGKEKAGVDVTVVSDEDNHTSTGKAEADDNTNTKVDKEIKSNESSDPLPFSDKKEQDSKGSSLSVSSRSSDDESEDEDEITKITNERSRGKRRRGRRDRSSKKDAAVDNASNVANINSEEKGSSEESHNCASNTNASPDSGEEGQPSSKKTPKKDDKRRCIGRKPVTDFIVGNTYSGKVRYIKPKLGAFIDIGCHSDAFCHISCVSNDFVSSVSDALKVDDVVEKARVLEVDKERKRVTVSLRSDGAAENEMERLKSTRQYEDGFAKKKKGHGGVDGGAKSVRNDNTRSGHIKFNDAASELKRSGANCGPSITTTEDSPKPKQRQHEVFPAISAGQKSSADLKRERKLARRAERRAVKEAAANL